MSNLNMIFLLNNPIILMLIAPSLLLLIVMFMLWRVSGRHQQLKQLELESRAAQHEQQQQQQLQMQTQQQWVSNIDHQLSNLGQCVSDSLMQQSKHNADSLAQNTKHTSEHLSQLREKLAALEATQAQFRDLNGHVVELKNILGNRQARGAMGEMQLHQLVKQILPPTMFQLQVTLSNQKRVDCLLLIPNPPGSIAIDAKFPLEGYRTWLAQTGDEVPVADDVSAEAELSENAVLSPTEGIPAERSPQAASESTALRQFRSDVKKHIDAISGRYIIAGETADFALMFIPAEAVYAEIYATLNDMVNYAFQKKVFLVSPTTLMAVLNTVRGVVRDVEMQQQVDQVKHLVGLILHDVERLGKRTNDLRKRFDLLGKDINGIETSQRAISNRAARIQQLEKSSGSDTATLTEVENSTDNDNRSTLTRPFNALN